MISSSIKLILFLSLFYPIAIHASGTKILSLVVTGSIAPAPEWQDANGLELSTINLSFEGLVANSSSNVPVQSQTQAVRLVNAGRYPASISLEKPSGCRIGTTQIQDSHLAFVFNSRTLGLADGLLNFTSERPQFFSLQFAQSGSYGRAFGAVTCAKNGSLVYVY